MKDRTMKRKGAARVAAASVLFAALQRASASAQGAEVAARQDACAGESGGITLPRRFCATVFADKVGHARHLVVAENGVVSVNTWSGVYYKNDAPLPGGFLIALKDTTGDGRADVNVRFGETVASGGRGGTGIELYSRDQRSHRPLRLD